MVLRSKKITKKQVILGVISCIIIALAFFCGCTRTLSNKEVKKYLESKYNMEFTYVGDGNDVWSSKTRTKIFADSNGDEVKVRYYAGSKDIAGDNYYSVIYDKEILNILKSELGDTYKIFVTTDASIYKRTYDSLDGYLSSGASMHIIMYAGNSNYNIYSIKSIIERLAINKFPNNLIDFIFVELNSDEFNSIEDAHTLGNSINKYTMKVKNDETINGLKHE